MLTNVRRDRAAVYSGELRERTGRDRRVITAMPLLQVSLSADRAAGGCAPSSATRCRSGPWRSLCLELATCPTPRAVRGDDHAGAGHPPTGAYFPVDGQRGANELARQGHGRSRDNRPP